MVLSHALGCDLRMWDGVVAILKTRYTLLRYDHRGHGRSASDGKTFGMQDLADDAATFIRRHSGGQRVHFVGLSMGGMTAQALGKQHPDLVQSLVIANSASHYDDQARSMWQTRIDTVLAKGIEPILDGAIQRWFSPGFRTDAACAAQVAASRRVLESTAPQAYALACAAVQQIDLRAGNTAISCPTLVIAGSLDEATPPAMSQAIAAQIPGARLATLASAHLSAIEQPHTFAELLLNFWA